MKIKRTLNAQEMNCVKGGDWVLKTYPDGTQEYIWIPNDEEPDEEDPFAW